MFCLIFLGAGGEQSENPVFFKGLCFFFSILFLKGRILSMLVVLICITYASLAWLCRH